MASHQGQGQGPRATNNPPGYAPGNPNDGGAGNQPPANQSSQPNQPPSGGDGNNQVFAPNATNFGDLSYLPQGQPTRGRGGYRGRGGRGRGGNYTPEERRQFFSATNPLILGPQFASSEIVGGNLGLVNKRTHDEFTNSILVEPANANMPERWLGTFNHTEGGVSMENMFKHTHPAKTETNEYRNVRSRLSDRSPRNRRTWRRRQVDTKPKPSTVPSPAIDQAPSAHSQGFAEATQAFESKPSTHESSTQPSIPGTSTLSQPNEDSAPGSVPSSIDERELIRRIIPFADDMTIVDGQGQTRKFGEDPNLCANCGKDSHVLAGCVLPSSSYWGDLYGCPMCNSKSHGFDQCRKQSDLDDWQRFSWLALRRRGKCLIRSEFPVFKAAIGFALAGRIPLDTILPWSRGGTKRIIAREDYAQRIQNITYPPDAQQAVAEDPATKIANLQELVLREDGSFQNFKDVNGEALQANTTEQRG